MDVPLWPNTQPQLAMHDRLRLTQAKMPDEVKLELLAPWYTQNTSESRTLGFFDAIPKFSNQGCAHLVVAGQVVPVRESGLNFFFGKRRRHQHRSGTLGRLVAL